jgi:hypothetical protein
MSRARGFAHPQSEVRIGAIQRQTASCPRSLAKFGAILIVPFKQPPPFFTNNHSQTNLSFLSLLKAIPTSSLERANHQTHISAAAAKIAALVQFDRGLNFCCLTLRQLLLDDITARPRGANTRPAFTFDPDSAIHAFEQSLKQFTGKSTERVQIVLAYSLVEIQSRGSKSAMLAAQLAQPLSTPPWPVIAKSVFCHQLSSRIPS